MSGSRIPVTLSMHPDQLARLDQIAADLDRSRSWVASRALGAFLAVTDLPSPASGLVSAMQAEPPGAGVVLAPVPALANSTEQPMPSLDTPDGTSRTAQHDTHGVHLQHLARVQEAAQRQAAGANAGRDAAFARSADYIANLGKSK